MRDGSTWRLQAYLKAPNAQTSDLFGISVAIDGDPIVVSARDEDSSQTTITNGATASADNSASAAGAVYVYVRSGTGWSEARSCSARPTPTPGRSLGRTSAPCIFFHRKCGRDWRSTRKSYGIKL